MNEPIRPARATAPGRIILRELEARGWSQQDLAAIMGRPEQMISEIICAKKQITADTARQLASAFGTSPEFWLNLEMHYQLYKTPVTVNETEIERRSTLYSLAPMNEIIKRGWIQPGKSIGELEQEYCQFFQVASIEQPPQVNLRLRVSEQRGPEDRAIVTWVRRVEQLAGEQSLGSFSIDRFTGMIDQLLHLSSSEALIEKIPSLFLENGIHFIIVPPIQKSDIDGATIWVKNNPVIALSLRYDRIDAFWFTLLHETAHIFLDQEQTQIDLALDKEDPNIGEEDKKANQLASEWLIPQEDFIDFIETHRPRFSRSSIEKFAMEHHRHPGIIIGQLMQRGELKYSHLREYLIKVRPILEKWIDKSSPEK